MADPGPRLVGRRTFARAATAPFAAALVAPSLLRQEPADGQLLGVLPFRVRPGPPFDRKLGSGLDGRLFTDLSTLQPGQGVTDTERFFIRTAASPRLPADWSVSVGGLVTRPQSFNLRTLTDLTVPSGTHLIECSGNDDSVGFGMLSVAEWAGVQVGHLLDRAGVRMDAAHVLVTGFDDESEPTMTSIPGASWIFSRDDLERAKSFLAVRMNGAPLTPDHGAPVRLIVPGWYGCACIKWVTGIEAVPGDAVPTSQMREYRSRTHQRGTPPLARDYEAAVIDTTATPVRIEKWLRRGRPAYRVVGVMWGGPTPTNALQIRFAANGPWVAVEDCPRPTSTTAWTVWSHWWQPAEPGRYDLVLKVADPAIRTRRLDIFYYVRTVDIVDV